MTKLEYFQAYRRSRTRTLSAITILGFVLCFLPFFANHETFDRLLDPSESDATLALAFYLPFAGPIVFLILTYLLIRRFASSSPPCPGCGQSPRTLSKLLVDGRGTCTTCGEQVVTFRS